MTSLAFTVMKRFRRVSWLFLPQLLLLLLKANGYALAQASGKLPCRQHSQRSGPCSKFTPIIGLQWRTGVAHIGIKRL